MDSSRFVLLLVYDANLTLIFNTYALFCPFTNLRRNTMLINCLVPAPKLFDLNSQENS
jgi:hypothetical protein